MGRDAEPGTGVEAFPVPRHGGFGFWDLDHQAAVRAGDCHGGTLAVITELEAKLARLEAKLARLERLISRNSGNSSMPPSGDDQPGRNPPGQKPRRGGGKRKPGKQPGAPGAYLAWSDHPDRTLEHAADLGVVFSHQVSDLPEEVRAQTVQYDRHQAICACGRMASKTIRALIILARVVCGDKTPLRAAPRRRKIPAGRVHQPAYLFLGERTLPSG